MTTGRGAVTEHEQEPIDAGMARKRSIWLAISGLIVVLLAIFIAQNIEDVPIEFLWFSGDVPLVLIIVIAMLLGAILGQTILFLRRRQKRRKGASS